MHHLSFLFCFLFFTNSLFGQLGIHPLFKIEDVYPSNEVELKVTAMQFAGDELYVTVMSPDRTNKAPFVDGEVFKITGLVGNSNKNNIKAKKLIGNLYEPAAIAIINGKIYVGEKDKISRFDDLNGDGLFQENEKTVLIDGLSQPNFHTYTIGFEKIVQGGKTYLVGNFTTSILLGGKRDINITINPKTKRGSTFVFGPVNGEEKPEEVDLQYLAGGYRTPNGITLGKDQAVFITDNQGVFNPANEFIRVTPGAFYGHYLHKRKNSNIAAFQPESVDSEFGGAEFQTPATVYMPQGISARSPSQPMMIKNQKGLNAVYNGQFLVGDVTLGKLNRIFIEEVLGEWQGAVFYHSAGHDPKGEHGFIAGPNRMIEGPDQKYYLGHIGAGGLWEFKGGPKKPWYGLQRMSWKNSSEMDPSFNEMVAMRNIKEGFEIEFYKPISERDLSIDKFSANQWTYIPNKGYGGRNIANESLVIKGLKVIENGKKVQLKIDGIRSNQLPFVEQNLKGHIYSNKNVGWVVQLKVKDLNLWTDIAWYTVKKHRGDQTVSAIANANQHDPAQMAKQIHKSVCGACHSTNGTKILGPSFKGLFGKRQTVIREGKEVEVVVDDAYLNRALSEPIYEHPKGYLPVMPDPVLGEAEQKAMVKFIKSFK